jgi:outer membrane protein OmpA-like peptidoglycan-associated protein
MSADDEKNDDIPAWIVSFTDMITLLLAFFVLLQAFAHEPDPEMFFEGQGSFKRAIESLGLPIWNKGKENRVKREWYIKKYSPDPDPNEDNNIPILDEEEEKLQRAFQKIRDKMDSVSADMVSEPLRVTATPIQFAGASPALNGSARAYLDAVAIDLKQNIAPTRCQLYIVGLAGDQHSSQARWIISAQRAQAVEAYLQQKLGAPWTVQAWGNGARYGKFPDSTQIGLVVMGATNG